MKTSNPAAEYFRIFVGGLSYDVDNHRLKESFQGFGSLKKALIIRDQHSGLSKGYGFVTFSSRASFEAAMRNPIYISGRKADCHQVLTKGALKEQEQRDMINKIFVGGISQNTTAEDLKKFFCKFGPIREARILYDGKSGKSRGFGFVLFRDEASAEQVLQSADYILKGKTIDVKKFCKEKGAEFETLESQQCSKAHSSKGHLEDVGQTNSKPSKCIQQSSSNEQAKAKPKKRQNKKQKPRLESMSTSSEKDYQLGCASKARPQRPAPVSESQNQRFESRLNPAQYDSRSTQVFRAESESEQRCSISGFYSSTQSLSQDCVYLSHHPKVHTQTCDSEHPQWGLHDYRLWHPSAGPTSPWRGWQSLIPGKFGPSLHY